MKLNDFERNTRSSILDRGYDYFYNDCVDNLEKVAPGLWMAQVYGTITYDVQVTTNKTRIKGWECSCPYDHGPICKHVVAVFYAIKEIMEADKKTTSSKKKTISKNRVQDIFGKASKEELQEFIIAQFKRDGGIKNAFVAHFAEYLDEDEQQKYRTIVRNIYKSAQDRHGFIDYHSASLLTNPLFELAEKANTLLAGKNLRESLAICKAIIEEIPIYLNNMDDSDGSAGDVFYYAFDTMNEIVQHVPPPLKDELFAYCIAEFTKEKYHGFGLEHSFLGLLPELVSTEDQERQFFELIDRQIEIKKTNSYSDYGVVSLIKAKMEYHLKAEREEEAFALIEAHKEYSEFREILINNAITIEDFETAKALCNEGIELANKKRHPGIVTKWEKKRLEIAKIEENTSEVRKWAEKLFFENYYNMNYYNELKATYSNQDWSDKCEELINKIKGENSLGGYSNFSALAEIFAEEKYLGRLLKLLQINGLSHSIVDNYAPLLKNNYPTEVLALYEKGIERVATQTGRSVYNEIASYLKKMKQIDGGNETVKAIIKRFRHQYNNRPAMMEILNSNFPETVAKSPK